MKVLGAYVQPDGGHHQEFLEVGRTAWASFHAREALWSTPGHFANKFGVLHFTVASMSWTAGTWRWTGAPRFRGVEGLHGAHGPLGGGGLACSRAQKRQRLSGGHRTLGKRRWDEAIQKQVLTEEETPWQCVTEDWENMASLEVSFLGRVLRQKKTHSEHRLHAKTTKVPSRYREEVNSSQCMPQVEVLM